MGGQSSTTRRVTVEEDDQSGVMKVSESVARRLMGQPESAHSGHDSSQRHAHEQQPPSQELQEEMQQMESYYKSKIKSLEERNAELFDDTKEQFAKAVQEVEQKFLKTTASPICQDLQNEVLKCYKANPNHTLYCSAQVQAFNECVQSQREKILTRKEG